MAILEPLCYGLARMAKWSFLTNHARVLVCIAHDPGVRLREIAAALAITERSAFGIVNELTEAGYVVKEKDGRRNRYQIQGHLPLRDTVARERTIGEILDILVEASAPDADTARRRTQRIPRPAQLGVMAALEQAVLTHPPRAAAVVQDSGCDDLTRAARNSCSAALSVSASAAR